MGLAGIVRLRGVSVLSGRGEDVSLGSHSSTARLEVVAAPKDSGRLEVIGTGSGILDWLDRRLVSRGGQKENVHLKQREFSQSQ